MTDKVIKLGDPRKNPAISEIVMYDIELEEILKANISRKSKRVRLHDNACCYIDTSPFVLIYASLRFLLPVHEGNVRRKT